MYCSPELPCAYPAGLYLVCLSLMLSGLFQIDVSAVMAVSLLPRGAVLTSQRSQQLETIRPGSSSRLKTWSVGHSARQSKLTTGTQTGVGRGEQPTCPTPVLSVSYYIEFDINYPDHLFPMAGFIPIFIDKEMGGQSVEMIWPESGSKKWSEPEFDLGDLVQDSLPTLFTDLGNCDTRKGVMDILVLMLQIHTHEENTACLLLRELSTPFSGMRD